MWFYDTSLKGALLDSIYTEPINDVEVILFRWKAKTNVFGVTYDKIVIKATQTDENGNFIIKFNRIKKRNYYLGLKLDSIPKGNMSYTYPDIFINNQWHAFDQFDIDTLIKHENIYLVKK